MADLWATATGIEFVLLLNITSVIIELIALEVISLIDNECNRAHACYNLVTNVNGILS